MARKSAGGFAAIHAARARRYKAALDAVEEALARAGIESPDEWPVEKRVGELASEVVALRRRVEDLEWESA